MFGTNPISLAAPAGREHPFVLDMATSTVAIGKLAVAVRWNKPIPDGWATRELGGHKGYGLAVMVDILAGVLAGASYADKNRRSPEEPTRANVGHFFGAIDVTRFRPLDLFRADMDDLLRALKDSPKAEGEERIWVAGEPEWECEKRRRTEGVPMAPGLVEQLRALAADLDLPFTLEPAG